MQQPETTLIYWAPSRVRFNLTLILAAVVVALGLLQAAGFDPLAAACSPRTATETTPPAAGGQSPGGETAPASSGRGGAYLLIIVGLGVGAYSWLTSPRQYRVYSDALVIMFGMPRRRTIHFSDIREVVLDRGFMGDPLRVYTTNRRRVPVQVREPEEMHQYLDAAVRDFRRANPQYAPAPDEDDAGGDRASDVVESTAMDGDMGEPTSGSASDGPQRSPRSRRRGLRDDDQAPDGGETGEGGESAGEGAQRSPRSRRRSLRDDTYDPANDDEPPRFS